MTERMLSAQQVGVIIGLTAQTVRGWVRSGKLTGVQLGPRTLRIPASEVEALLQQK